MDVEELDKACRAFPAVRELLEYNLHLSVSALAREIRDKLTTFDANHTQAQAKLVDRMRALEERMDSWAIFSRDLQERVKKLEAKPKEAAGD